MATTTKARIPLRDRLAIRHQLCESATSVVFLCTLKSDPRTKKVLKIIGNYDDGRDGNEHRIISEYKHENIIELEEVCIENEQNRCFLVFPAYEGTLVDYAGIMPEATVASIFYQVMKAVEYLHSEGIVHGDIKLQNVLWKYGDSLDIRLADFQFARKLEPGEKHFICGAGSPEYLAPEIIVERRCGKESDIWASGILLYALIAGKLPFDVSVSFDNTFERNFRTPLEELPLYRNNDAIELINSLLQIDLTERPTASTILKHNFFNQIDN